MKQVDCFLNVIKKICESSSSLRWTSLRCAGQLSRHERVVISSNDIDRVSLCGMWYLSAQQLFFSSCQQIDSSFRRRGHTQLLLFDHCSARILADTLLQPLGSGPNKCGVTMSVMEIMRVFQFLSSLVFQSFSSKPCGFWHQWPQNHRCFIGLTSCL